MSELDTSQNLPYSEGSVWMITLVKVKPGMIDAYLREIGPGRKKLMDEAQDQGIILSHKILNGFSCGRDDWDLMLMVEYANFAAIDGLSTRFESLMAKHIGSQLQCVQLVNSRDESREILGTKVLQEITLNTGAIEQ